MQLAMTDVCNSSIRELTREEMSLISGGGPGDGAIAVGEVIFGLGGGGVMTGNPIAAGIGGGLMIIGGLTVFAGIVINGSSNTAT